MPQREWINNVQLIPENMSYKVDGSGRIIIPAHLRNKFQIGLGDRVEYFTAFIDDSWFLCVRLDKEATEAEKEKEKKNAENL